ncbi:MAG TPA: alpha-1,2-fucosyltransferase [Anaerolineales bacterium]|nr:alpha-1,2-fucosyltransferase [Anaerolineales bacterium]
MIISFSMLGSHGRLGNQLFEVASTLGMAERYGAEAAFPEWKYEQYFDPPLPHGELQTKKVTEQYFHFYDWGIKESCDLVGYLQSEKYFGSTRLKFKDEFIQEVKEKHAGIFEKPTICVQIRRGDYVGNGNYHQLTVNWYIDALLKNFPNWREHNILFISDDIEYCRVHFECLPNAYFSTGNTDIEDMALASCCDHFIISNSSYGWWCAWFGEKPHSTIIHCGCLHSGKLTSKGNEDYYPERWIEHKSESHKIPLKDVTFTIPVHFDHMDRKTNLDLSLFLLQSAFDTNFIICEQGSSKFEYTKKWGNYMRCDSKHFHRTKMLNDMSNTAETDIIVNWDCDVIIPPMQILMAVEELRAGADMVFPYDGKFARIPRAPWFAKIQKHRDIGIVGAEHFKGREDDHNSVGGAVMFNRNAFMDGGMENEHMISFGPEDCERHDRFKTLGYDIRRVKGSLFHLNHFVGPNSSSRNPHFRDNHAELEKIRAMSAEQLRDYVDTWSWRHKYTSSYYHRISEGSIRSAKIVMQELVANCGLAVDSRVIDIGCGVGEWNNGNPNYVGLDYRIKKKDLLIPAERFIECDLEHEFYQSDTKFDLCLCLEVAEHLRPDRAEGLVKMLCSLSDFVLFSAAIPFQGGTGHVNEQWQSWWAELFSQHYFFAWDVQPEIRSNPDVELWYRNNMILYRRGGAHVVEDLILPEFYMQIVGHLRRIHAT